MSDQSELLPVSQEVLKPCPFCGSPGDLIEDVDYNSGKPNGSWIARCIPCDLIPDQCWCKSRDEAIAAWNTRFERDTIARHRLSGEVDERCPHCHGEGDIDHGDHSCMRCGGSGRVTALSDPHRLSVGEVDINTAARAMWIADGGRPSLWDNQEGAAWQSHMETSRQRFIKLATAALSPTDRPDGEEVERLRGLSEKATPGLWHHGGSVLGPDWQGADWNGDSEAAHKIWPDPGTVGRLIATTGTNFTGHIQQDADNAAFIVAAVNYVRAALSSAGEG